MRLYQNLVNISGWNFSIIDEIIVFKTLKEDDCRRILIQQLDIFSQRVMLKQKIAITFSDTAIDSLLYSGYSPQLGARELQRVIEKMIQIPLSIALTKGNNKKEWMFDSKDNQIFLI